MASEPHKRQPVQMICKITSAKGEVGVFSFRLDEPLASFHQDAFPAGWTAEIVKVIWE